MAYYGDLNFIFMDFELTANFSNPRVQYYSEPMVKTQSSNKFQTR